MLSRTASDLYWMSRYLERAENLARMLDVSYSLSLLPQDRNGGGLDELAMPLLITGLRSATLQVIATAMLAAYVGNGGLGRFIFLGLKTQDYPQMLGGSLLVIALAIAVEALLLGIQRLTAPRGLA